MTMNPVWMKSVKNIAEN